MEASPVLALIVASRPNPCLTGRLDDADFSFCSAATASLIVPVSPPFAVRTVPDPHYSVIKDRSPVR